MATAEVRNGEVTVGSSLLLLEQEQLNFYRAKGRALRSAK
jgi:hypothetical protein